jgi:hypothetical protein
VTNPARDHEHTARAEWRDCPPPGHFYHNSSDSRDTSNSRPKITLFATIAIEIIAAAVRLLDEWETNKKKTAFHN